MTKVIALLCVGVFAVGLLTGCQIVKSPALGVMYTDVSDGMAATGNVGSSKVGSATATSILGWVATGDASIDAASRAGGITKIHHVDYHSKNILGVYGQYTVTVYGE
jgi:hypothetical protein